MQCVDLHRQAVLILNSQYATCRSKTDLNLFTSTSSVLAVAEIAIVQNKHVRVNERRNMGNDDYTLLFASGRIGTGQRRLYLMYLLWFVGQ